MHVDFIIIGGGLAGASAAYYLSQSGSVVLLEQEEHFGEHSSGRTAGLFTTGISARHMRALAAASRSFFVNPPADLGGETLIQPRGSLTIGPLEKQAALETLCARIQGAGGSSALLDRDGAMELFPALRPEQFDIAAYEKDAWDIDVNALLQGYLRAARKNNARLVSRCQVHGICQNGDQWQVQCQDEQFVAPILVNAAGAWGDVVNELAGVQPVGLTPYKRTAFTFNLLPDGKGADWPMVSNTKFDWYVKPEHGCFMGSPSDAVAVAPGDVYSDDLDVAQGAYNIEAATHLTVGRPIGTWAGLRSYVADRNPVCGMRKAAPGFIILAGQGGCGVLASPALGQAVNAIALSRELPDGLRSAGLTREDLSPDRDALITTT